MNSRIYFLINPRIEAEDRKYPRQRVWLREGTPIFLPDGAAVEVEFQVEGSQYKAVVTINDGIKELVLPITRGCEVDIEAQHGVRIVARAAEFSLFGHPEAMMVDVLNVASTAQEKAV